MYAEDISKWLAKRVDSNKCAYMVLPRESHCSSVTKIDQGREMKPCPGGGLFRRGYAVGIPKLKADCDIYCFLKFTKCLYADTVFSQKSTEAGIIIIVITTVLPAVIILTV